MNSNDRIKRRLYDTALCENYRPFLTLHGLDKNQSTRAARSWVLPISAGEDSASLRTH
ncbi:hypothetical protein [Nitrosomonas cryotolerans]|uniref:hypothetical protein n=1 Tax=Nitrosomonas cryotolerans TaxID=44575 RepID=UPI000A548AD9|nr:hypothetical protein [Nitrosomonas cryotolerans]